jgi:hypothetical protein
MEEKLVEMVNRILRMDSRRYWWHKDEALNGHFKIGSINEEYIEYSKEVVDEEPIGKLVVYRKEDVQLRWIVDESSPLYELLNYLEQDAMRLTKDPDYMKSLKDSDDLEGKSRELGSLVYTFFHKL